MQALSLLLAQFKSPIILILLFAAVLSLFLGEATDALIILAIVLASGLLGFWQEWGAADAMKKLLALVQTKASVLRDGQARRCPFRAGRAGGRRTPERRRHRPRRRPHPGRDGPLRRRGDPDRRDLPRREGGRGGATGRPARSAYELRLLGNQRRQRHGTAAGRPHRPGYGVRPDFRVTPAPAAGDRVRARHPPLRLPAAGGDSAAGPADLRHQRRVPPAGPGVVPLLRGDRRRADPATASGDHQRQPGPRGAPHGPRAGHRSQAGVHREPRQHGRALLGQDRHADRGQGAPARCRRCRRQAERSGRGFTPISTPPSSRLLQPHRRGHRRRRVRGGDRLPQARRGALRFRPQATQRAGRRGREEPAGDQGGAGERAGSLHGRRGGTRRRGGFGRDATADRAALRRVQRPGLPHPGGRLSGHGLRDRDSQGPRVGDDVPGPAGLRRPAQGRDRRDDQESPRPRDRHEAHHRGQPPGRRPRRRPGRAAGAPSSPGPTCDK